MTAIANVATTEYEMYWMKMYENGANLQDFPDAVMQDNNVLIGQRILHWSHIHHSSWEDNPLIAPSDMCCCQKWADQEEWE